MENLPIEEKTILKVLNNKEISKKNIDVIKKFETQERANGSALNTIKNKMMSLEKFCLFFKKDFDKSKKQDIVNYCAYLEKNYHGGTPITHKAIIKSFYKWFYIDYMKWKQKYEKEYPEIVSWMKITNGNGKHKLPEELLTQEEIKKLVNTTTSLRNKALIMLLYDGALRISEATGLKIKNIVFDSYGGYIIIPKSKTGMRKVRLVDSIPYIKNYLDKEHLYKDDPNCNLFIGVESKGVKKNDLGRPLDPNGARILLRRLSIKAGIKKRVFPHLFRHSKLTEMAKDFTEQEMKIFAGWTGGSNMPQVYVHLSGEDVEKKILEKKGVIKEESKERKNKLKPKRCIDPNCNHLNPATYNFCEKCHRPIDAKTIIGIEEKQKEADKVFEKTMVKHGSINRELLKETLKELIKEGKIKI